MAATTYDDGNANVAPQKSIFDAQQIHRPRVYRQCGRASALLGAVCICAEMSVFVLKRGIPSAGVGIWTGAPFVVLGAVAMAVPRTRTVFSVNACCCVCAGAMLVSLLGTVACFLQIARTSAIVQQNITPRPNFELVCAACAHYLIAKEAVHILLLIVQLAVCCVLLLQLNADCLCCHSTITEVIVPGDFVPPPQASANQSAASLPPPPPPQASANQSAASLPPPPPPPPPPQATPMANRRAAPVLVAANRHASPAMRRSMSAARVESGGSAAAAAAGHQRSAVPMLFEL